MTRESITVMADDPDGTDDSFGDDGTDDSAGTDGTSEDPGDSGDPSDGTTGDPTETGPTPAPPTPAPPTAPPAPRLTTFRFDSVQIDASGTADASKVMPVGNGATLPLTVGYSICSFDGPSAKPRVTLQRSVSGGAWHAIRSVPIPKTANGTCASGSTAVWTPRYRTSASTATVLYRLDSTAYRSGPTGIESPSRITGMKLRYENQAKYTGLRKQMYDLQKAYCPTSAIHMVSSASIGGFAGMYWTGGLLIRFSRSAAQGMTTDYRTSLAIHECAHEHQVLNYGSTWAGWNAMEKAAKRIYTNDRKPASVRVPYPYFAGGIPGMTFNPVEHGADCASQSAHAGGYLGYGGYCDPKELKEGRKLLRGGRY
jgi:hypothetical protein